ncbi:MAG: GerW family sporulation protein [Clostridia bacterium]|nr:GerW family sporulation protein [Clostridia bacterium]MBQ3553339.1 GerW family sporulation protein [Clostridia bacterium]
MAEHPIKGLMETAMKSIKDMVDVNTIVGDAVESKDGTVIIPISKVSFGFGAGGSEFGNRASLAPDANANFGGGSGGGASIEPVAFMVVGQGQIKLLPMEKNSSPIEDVIEKVPSLLDKLSDLFKKKEGKKAKKAKNEGDVTIETIETVTVSDEA